MKQVIETFVAVFIVTLAIFVFAQFIGASTQIDAARKFHSSCIGQIESSDFDTEVIEACSASAEENGYVLSVENEREEKWICTGCNTIQTGGEVMTCVNCGLTENVTYAKDRFCKVSMKYTVYLGLLGIEKEGNLSGYAR